MHRLVPDPSRRAFLQQLAALGVIAALPGRAFAGLGDSVSIKLRNPEATRLLNPALTQESYWSGASTSKFTDQLYDEIRLKEINSGYLALITGEGDQDFTIPDVARTVFDHQDKLSRHMDGAKAVPRLASGTDPTFGVPYCDRYMLADMTAFYAEYFQRMYRFDLSDGRAVLAYEKIQTSWLDATTLARYQQVRSDTLARVSLRSVFGSVVEFTDSFGMFVVSKGSTRATRVTLVASLTFGEGTGMIAQMGSKMPMVLKAGLKSGFDASVAVARHVSSGKYK
jgi:hypothetical protein